MNPAQKASALFHQWFENEDHQYSEYEASDVEYFIAVMMYNQLDFRLAVPTMKTMDIGSDFYGAAKETYKEAAKLLETLKFDTDEEAAAFLMEFINHSQARYNSSERYLLDRIEKHIRLLQERYETGETPSTVNFETPKQATYKFN